MLLVVTTNVEARLKYYRYSHNIPMVEMSLNMMDAMGVLDQIPRELVNDGNPYNRLATAGYNPYTRSPYGYRINAPYYSNRLYDIYGAVCTVLTAVATIDTMAVTTVMVPAMVAGGTCGIVPGEETAGPARVVGAGANPGVDYGTINGTVPGVIPGVVPTVTSRIVPGTIPMAAGVVINGVIRGEVTGIIHG